MRTEVFIECELLDEGALSAGELARACGMAEVWVIERAEHGLLDAPRAEDGRFDAAVLARARRLAWL